ncbi:MAG: HD domain-containing protein [Planctomycetaceae bacterium]|jgi:HD superfamily phosphohydrolase|nr:HD domain-containing protein [Planctomycetaceae bacterium]
MIGKDQVQGINLIQDTIHGYIPFCSADVNEADEVSERDLIDSAWVQRLRQIHQLQTAWWVFPSAEHTRFQHVLGAMHLASRMVLKLYPSLCGVCQEIGETVPSLPCVEAMTRIAALLHDVGHGPFGHFFDEHFLKRYTVKTTDESGKSLELPMTHETLGAEIIRRKLGMMIRKIRRSPSGRLAENELIDPDQIAWLIVRPNERTDILANRPRWLQLLRALFCGLYTVDNMDFVLRDAYTSGYSSHSFDLDRLILYSFFTEKGLTIHQRGVAALTRFISVRAELFRVVYYHRTVRAIDLALREAFQESERLIFPGNPLADDETLEKYLYFTDWSLLVDVATWDKSANPQKQAAAHLWRDIVFRKTMWHLVIERTVLFQQGAKEQASVFSSETLLETAIRSNLPNDLRQIEMRVDIPRHAQRPGAHLPSANLNFLYDPASEQIQRLEEEELFRDIPQSYRICRIYTGEENVRNTKIKTALVQAFDRLTSQGRPADDATNM